MRYVSSPLANDAVEPVQPSWLTRLLTLAFARYIKE